MDRQYSCLPEGRYAELEARRSALTRKDSCTRTVPSEHEPLSLSQVILCIRPLITRLGEPSLAQNSQTRHLKQVPTT